MKYISSDIDAVVEKLTTIHVLHPNLNITIDTGTESISIALYNERLIPDRTMEKELENFLNTP